MKELFYLVVLMLVSACSSQEEDQMSNIGYESSKQVAYVTIPDTCHVVTMQTVESIAKSFIVNKVSTRSSEKEINNIHTVCSENDTPLFYIVNYKDSQGFIIISATKDYMPVLAFSDTGCFDVDQTNKTGVSLWMAEQKVGISSVAEFPDSIKMKYRALWTDYNTQKKEIAIRTRSRDDVFELISGSVNEWEAEGYTVYCLAQYKETDEFRNLPQEVQNRLLTLPLGYANSHYGGRENVSFVLKKNTSVSHSVSPLLKTTWGQEAGFNSSIITNVPVGCTAIAMGQIMKYHKYPLNYSWNDMPDNYATSTTADYLAEVGRKIGINYDAGESDANITNVASVFKTFGYNAITVCNHDSYKVISELEKNKPVYMRGYDSSGFLGIGVKGHAWVCDGYFSGTGSYQLRLMTLEDCPESHEPTCFLNPYTYDAIVSVTPPSFHMNWGWYGLNDGYYADDNLWLKANGKDYNFAHGRKDIINIYPSQY